MVEGEGLLGTRDDYEHVDVSEVGEFGRVDAAYVERVEFLLLNLHQALEHLVDFGVISTRERAHDDSEDLGLISRSHHERVPPSNERGRGVARSGELSFTVDSEDYGEVRVAQS